MGNVYLTEDGGKTFKDVLDFGSNSIAVINDSSAVGVGFRHKIHLTTNLGKSWKVFDLPDWGDFTDVQFVNENIGVVVGESGVIYKSNDSGNSWDKISIGTHDWKISMSFVNENFGCVAGYEHLVTTSNGGNSWQKKDFQYFRGFSSVFFVDSLYGWGSSIDLDENFRNGRIYITEDGGDTWTILRESPKVRDIFFVNRNLGWAVAGFQITHENEGGRTEHFGHLYKSTDGGLNWEKHNEVFDNEFTSIFFIDSLNGWVSGRNGSMTSLSTRDGGKSWTESPCQIGANSLYFTDTLNGYAVGWSWVKYGKTTDGGLTWQYLDIQPDSLYVGDLHGVHFPSKNNGWIVGDDGQIYKTTDAGENWNLNILDTDIDLYDVYFVTDKIGWICGNNGLIMKTTNGGITFVEEGSDPSLKKKFILEQNYPNPFNSTTTVVFSIPRESFVKISIYNILGQLVKVITNKLYTRGNHVLNIDASEFSSGVYFYRLESKKEIITKKFVLIR